MIERIGRWLNENLGDLLREDRAAKCKRELAEVLDRIRAGRERSKVHLANRLCEQVERDERIEHHKQKLRELKVELETSLNPEEVRARIRDRRQLLERDEQRYQAARQLTEEDQRLVAELETDLCRLTGYQEQVEFELDVAARNRRSQEAVDEIINEETRTQAEQAFRSAVALVQELNSEHAPELPEETSQDLKSPASIDEVLQLQEATIAGQEQIKTARNELQKREEQLQERSESLKHQARELNEKERLLKGIEQALRDREARLEDPQALIEYLEGQTPEHLRGRLERLKPEVTSYAGEVERLKRELHNLQAERDSLAIQRKDLTQEQAKIKQALKSQHDAITTAAAELEDLKASINQCEEKARELRGSTEQAHAEQASVDQQLKAALKAHHQAQEELREAKTRLEALDQDSLDRRAKTKVQEAIAAIGKGT